MLNTTITVGTGQSIHWACGGAALCGADYRNGIVASRKPVKADAATCKRCIKIMLVQVEADHAAALLVEEIEQARAEAKSEDAQRTDDAHRAADLAAPSVRYPAAIALDTWLTEGLVLVGPATDTLLVFERWDGGTAVLSHVSSGLSLRVEQSVITNWRYLPGMDRTGAQADEDAMADATPEAHAEAFHSGSDCVRGAVCPWPTADRVVVGDVVQFVPGGRDWTVSGVELHEGTTLRSFTVRGSLREFARHDHEQVRRTLAPPR